MTAKIFLKKKGIKVSFYLLRKFLDIYPNSPKKKIIITQKEE